MAIRGRKPIPKTQKEISNSLVDPYDKSLGNPNPANPNHINRGEQVSLKGDTTKTFSVGIQDIDESIFYYFENVIRPTVYQNGERIAVPIIYGSPERWKSVQRDGYYRDKNGAIMSPIIMFKLNSVAKDRSVANKLDANSPTQYGVYGKSYDPKNAYDNFAVLNNRIPDKTYYNVVIPDYVTMQYSCLIQTYYIEQLNKIVEAINYASDSYWGNPERFKFRARIDSFNTVTEVPTTDNRIVRSNFNINLRGYIVPEIIQKSLTTVPKYRDRSKIIFSMEVSSNPEIYNGNIEGDRIVS